MTTLPCFGVHKDRDGINYLVQANGVSNAVGLHSSPSMGVALPKRKCNHEIFLNEKTNPVYLEALDNAIKEDQQRWESSILRLMLPVPRGTYNGVFYRRESEQLLNWISALSEMSSPIMPVVVPIWKYKDKREIFEQLNLTNIQPLALTGIRSGDISLVKELAEVSENSERRLIFTGHIEYFYMPSKIDEFTVNDNGYKVANWRKSGTLYLARWMREN